MIEIALKGVAIFLLLGFGALNAFLLYCLYKSIAE